MGEIGTRVGSQGRGGGSSPGVSCTPFPSTVGAQSGCPANQFRGHWEVGGGIGTRVGYQARGGGSSPGVSCTPFLSPLYSWCSVWWCC